LSAKAAAVVMALTLFLGACGPDPATPRGVAQRFLDAYFGLDLNTALEASASRAHELIEEERRLTAGQPIDAATRVPTIGYRLLREEPGTDATVHLVYVVRITVPGAETNEQRWLLTIARSESEWKVVNFTRTGEGQRTGSRSQPLPDIAWQLHPATLDVVEHVLRIGPQHAMDL
jgi:hypothetical protein